MSEESSILGEKSATLLQEHKTVHVHLLNMTERNPMYPMFHTLHPAPQLVQWLERYNSMFLDMVRGGYKATPTSVRAGLANLTRSLVTERCEIALVQDDCIAGAAFNIPVRMYHPQPACHLPVLLYFHGGGHMAGSVSVYDFICRKIAAVSMHVVVSVEYRLAPEYPYPAGVNDALCAVKNVWHTLAQRQLKVTPRLSVAGDSAGGTLCATVSHLTQYNHDVSIFKQILIYPCLDYTLQAASVSENATGYLLEKDKIAWYFTNYFRNQENRRDASPLFMEFSQNLPESLVITAEFCPLRDDGVLYIEKLRGAGGVGRHLHFTTMIHAFLNMEDLVKDQCSTLYQEVGAFLNDEKRI